MGETAIHSIAKVDADINAIFHFPLQQYRQENQRLKDENGALIRVISKLSK